MTARRRRALAAAAGAVLVAVLCAALSTSVSGVQRTVLVVLTFAWLVIAASCVVNAVRTAQEAPAAEAVPAGEDMTSVDDPG